MNNFSKCPICGLNVTQKYFAFPKLPVSCQFATIFGLVHIDCLNSHPQKREIQKELTLIYLQIFKNHPDFPIVSQVDCILIKSRPDQKLLEIHDFEDFVEFYIPYNQLAQIFSMNANQEIRLGVNKWTFLIANNKGQLSLIRKFPKNNDVDIIKLSYLNLENLKKMLQKASLKI